jgi:hypothetical protein
MRSEHVDGTRSARVGRVICTILGDKFREFSVRDLRKGYERRYAPHWVRWDRISDAYGFEPCAMRCTPLENSRRAEHAARARMSEIENWDDSCKFEVRVLEG